MQATVLYGPRDIRFEESGTGGIVAARRAIEAPLHPRTATAGSR